MMNAPNKVNNSTQRKAKAELFRGFKKNDYIVHMAKLVQK